MAELPLNALVEIEAWAWVGGPGKRERESPPMTGAILLVVLLLLFPSSWP